MKELSIQVPAYWKAGDTPGVYTCQLPPCPHRRYAHKVEDGQVLVRLQCSHQHRDCTATECESCPRAGEGVRNTTAPARPDLQAILDTLPLPKPGRDREVRIEDDGAIVYTRGQDDEEPNTINGYERDPTDPWRFTPLWPLCAMRHQIGVRYASCGCINVVMRCNAPEHPRYMDRIGHEDCQACLLRK